MLTRLKEWKRKLAGLALFGLLGVTYATAVSYTPAAPRLQALLAQQGAVELRDRYGQPLTHSAPDGWNLHEQVPLHAIPELLQQAVITAEDKRFYRHGGIDWTARLHALWQNMKAGRTVRGASTLSEQTVRLLTPRPRHHLARNLWARWMEGWEAIGLERQFSKSEILEFYLNQVPYAANRRGVAQAARYYFGRSLSTLSPKEMLALAVMVRAPSALRPDRHGKRLEAGITRLTEQLARDGLLTAEEVARLRHATLSPAMKPMASAVAAPHFARYVWQHLPAGFANRNLSTTLDGSLQETVRQLTDERLKKLAAHQVHNAAVLVADHRSGEILAWVVGGAGDGATPGRFINAVTAPRQPGSALKPFLYALALENGSRNTARNLPHSTLPHSTLSDTTLPDTTLWTAATPLKDEPLSEMVGTGLHQYRNYSRLYYGEVTLRQALGNSLNIPAVRTLQALTPERYLMTLRRLGFQSLGEHPDRYGDGLALGNGEVTLLEMVQAYTALAHGGQWRPLRFLPPEYSQGTTAGEAPRRIFHETTASLIGDILSDPFARAYEFGQHSIMNFPVQTAIKTGTSSDYRDAWAFGYNYRYVVGVWMGNLNQEATDGLTGATGPVLLLRSIFAELTRGQATRPLPMSAALERHDICQHPLRRKREGEDCDSYSEIFAPGTVPAYDTALAAPQMPETLRLRQPTGGLRMAYDPRIPAEMQEFEFQMQGLQAGDTVEWFLNGRHLATTPDGRYPWRVSRGVHRLKVLVWREGALFASLKPVTFYVK
jgi:penicillin-binding protein 1C